MNLVDCVVTKILSEPYQAYGKWWVKVEFNSWGNNSVTELMFNAAVDAEKVSVGYNFVS